MASHRFKELDIIRGFATCWVVGLHFWLLHFMPAYFNFQERDRYMDNYSDYLKFVGESWSLERLFPLPFNSFDNLLFNGVNTFFLMGYQGVHLFFVLSGFGLTISMLSQPHQKWFEFIKSKFFRLYPTCWVLLVICLLCPLLKQQLFYGYFDYDGTLSRILRSFLILDDAIPFSWFMFPLIQFYLAFVPLFYFLKKTSIQRFLLTILIIKILYTFTVLEISYYIDPAIKGNGSYPGFFAISRAFEFALGMAFGKIYYESPQYLIVFLTRRSTFLLAILCEFLGCLGLFPITNKIKAFGYILPIGLSVYDALIGFGIFVIVFNLSRWIIRDFKPLDIFLSISSGLSYEMYLTHFIALSTISRSFFANDLPDESAASTLIRVLLLYAIALQVCIVCAIGLRSLTKLTLAQRNRLAVFKL